MRDNSSNNSGSASSPGLSVRCPGCGGASAYHVDNPYRPFCSARCKQIDLGAWSSEQFRVEAQPEPSDDNPMN